MKHKFSVIRIGIFWPLGDIHKPRGQLRGVSQMTILLHKPYYVKVTTKGEGGGVKYTQKFDNLVYV